MNYYDFLCILLIFFKGHWEDWRLDIVSISSSSSNLFCFMYFLLRNRILKGCLSNSKKIFDFNGFIVIILSLCIYTRKLVYWNFFLWVWTLQKEAVALVYWLIGQLWKPQWGIICRNLLSIFFTKNYVKSKYLLSLYTFFMKYIFKGEWIYRFYTVEECCNTNSYSMEIVKLFFSTKFPWNQLFHQWITICWFHEIFFKWD